MMTLPVLGSRFQLTETVERFPHFLVQAGATGTVVDASTSAVSLHMDDYVPGAEAWDNELVWTVEDHYDDGGEPAVNPSTAAAFAQATEPVNEPAIPPEAQSPREASTLPFERDRHEGTALEPIDGLTSSDGTPMWFDVLHRGTPIGRVIFHEPTSSADGLPGAAHWSARAADGECVNRSASGVTVGGALLAGERTREAAVALVIAAHFSH